MSDARRVDELEAEVASLRRQIAARSSTPATEEEAVARMLGNRIVLENIPDVVMIVSREQRVLYANRSFHGKPAAEVQGRGASDALQKDERARFRATFERTWLSGAAETIELHPLSGGAWESRLVPVKSSGDVLFMLCTSTEVTQRRTAEEALRASESRLRHAIDATGMGTWSWDLATGRVSWDAGMLRIYGLSADAAPKSFEESIALVHPEDRTQSARRLRAELEVGAVEDVEHRIVRPDGEVRHVVAKGTIVYDDSGRPIGLRGGTLDITDRKRFAEQIHHVQKMEAVGQLTAGVAHNFNNILSVISPNAALCREGASEESLARLADIEDAARRAAAMVQQLMLFARHDASRAKGHVDIADLVQRTVVMCRTTFDKRIGLHLELDDAPNLFAYANANQIEQVLLNVCLNARDALNDSDTAEPRIDVRVASRQESRVQIRVVDNGPGMDAATRARVFEPFFTTKPFGQGTGLGLASAYAIVTDHGGTIRCESEPGRGTTFEIDLPAAEGPSSTQARHESTKPVGGTESILVVDDEATVRRAVRAVLERNGYRVAEAADGASGLALVEAASIEIDLVILDRSMPGMSGDEVLARLGDVAPRIPVLLMSGAPGAEDGTERAAAVLAKPASIQSLLGTLRRVLDHRR